MDTPRQAWQRGEKIWGSYERKREEEIHRVHTIKLIIKYEYADMVKTELADNRGRDTKEM